MNAGAGHTGTDLGGRVALVAGLGAGPRRSEALTLASLGANVVINELIAIR